MRTFVDETGTEWTVWEVQPRSALLGLDERRHPVERRHTTAPEPIVERRVADERRVRRLERPPAVGRELMDGWLAFQSAAERRRLTPVPAGWQTHSNDDLRAWCRTAARVAFRLGGEDWTSGGADTSGARGN